VMIKYLADESMYNKMLHRLQIVDTVE